MQGRTSAFMDSARRTAWGVNLESTTLLTACVVVRVALVVGMQGGCVDTLL